MRRVTCLMRRRGTCLGGDTSVSKCMNILWVSVGEGECEREECKGGRERCDGENKECEREREECQGKSEIKRSG